MLLFFSTALWAECGEPLSMRYSLPRAGATSMPVEIQPFLSFLGDGSVEQLDVTLNSVDGAEVEAVEITTIAECYVHESDTEKHCNWRLIPAEPLQENHSYLIRVEPTSAHPESGWEEEVAFTTGESRETQTVEPPLLEIIKYGPRDSFGLDSCDWQDAYSYEFFAYIETFDSLKSYFNVYEVTDEGAEIYQHTIFVEPNMDRTDFRQVLAPGTEGGRCYFLVHVLLTGEESAPSEMFCHDGSIYPSVNEPSEEPSEPSEEVIVDEEEADDGSGNKKKGGGEPQVELVQSGGCGSDKAWWLLFPILGVRRKKSSM